MADRFTRKIAAAEYTVFLNRLIGRIVAFDPTTGEIALRAEEDIIALGDEDPLLDEVTSEALLKKR